MCEYICMCVYYTASWGNSTGLTCTLAILVKLHQHNSVSIDTNLPHFIEFTLATSLLEWTTMKYLSIMNLVSNYLTQFLHCTKWLLSDRLYHLKKKKIPQQVMTKRRKEDCDSFFFFLRLWFFRHGVSLVFVNPFSLLEK